MNIVGFEPGSIIATFILNYEDNLIDSSQLIQNAIQNSSNSSLLTIDPDKVFVRRLNSSILHFV